MSEYLQGSWFEAETKLLGLLRSAPRDVEARLLVATLLRRTRRHAEALDQLDRLERLRDAAKWSREISEERQHIAAATASLKLAEPGPAPDISQSRETRQAA
jgi:cytochrome c-type biogenesis protein CcmH/NrfG